MKRLYNFFLREELSQLFVSVRGPGVSSALGGSVVGIEGTQSLRRASSIRRTFTTGTAGIKRKSVCLQVKFTVVSLSYILIKFVDEVRIFEILKTYTSG